MRSPHVSTQYTQHTVSCWWFKICSIQIHNHSMCLISTCFCLGDVMFWKHLTSPLRSAVSHLMSVHRGLWMRACRTSNGWGRWKRSLRIRSTLPSLVGRMIMNQWILGFSLKDYIMCYHVTAHLAKERCARWFIIGNCHTFGSLWAFRSVCVRASRWYMLIYGRPLISGSLAEETGTHTKSPWMWSWRILSIKRIKSIRWQPQCHRCVWTCLDHLVAIGGCHANHASQCCGSQGRHFKTRSNNLHCVQKVHQTFPCELVLCALYFF